MNNESIESSGTSQNTNKINVDDTLIKSEASNPDSTKIEINSTLTTASPIPLKSLDYAHEETMMDKKYNYEKQLLDKKLGYLGRVFGYEYILPLNVSGLFILVLVLFLTIVSLCLFKKVNNADYKITIEIIESLWGIVAPLLTLALGYLFGKRGT